MIAWLLEEQALTLAPTLDEMFEHETLVVPAHWPAEIGNGLVTNMRRNRVPPDKMDILITQCAVLDIVIEPPVSVEQIGTVVHLAGMQRLTFYDAAYLQLALERSIPLGTLDQDMRSAAQRLGIRLFPA